MRSKWDLSSTGKPSGESGNNSLSLANYLNIEELATLYPSRL